MTPFSKEVLHFVGYAFVDDTNVIVSKASKWADCMRMGRIPKDDA